MSGWGFEFTCRVARAAGEDQAPVWAANVLQNLARYVESSGNVFGVGHHLDLNGPVKLDRPDTAVRAIAFAEDPEVGSIDTAHGRLRFLQVVGITPEEYDPAQRWDTGHLLSALRRRLPLLVTDPDRPTLTADPEIAAEIDAGIRRDGSSTDSVFIEEAGWTREAGRIVLTLGATAAERVARIVPGRLPFGRPIALFTAGAGVLLTGPVADRLCATLRPVAGRYTVPDAPDLVIEVVRSQIRDQQGTVVREIG